MLFQSIMGYNCYKTHVFYGKNIAKANLDKGKLSMDNISEARSDNNDILCDIITPF